MSSFAENLADVFAVAYQDLCTRKGCEEKATRTVGGRRLCNVHGIRYGHWLHVNGRCTLADHDASLPDEWWLIPQNATMDGRLACNDCGEAMYWCENTEWYHHVNPRKECFLIAADEEGSK